MLRDLKPTDNVGGFDVRPGNFLLNGATRSEEHTSELQSRFDLVCRLLLEKKKKKNNEEYTERRRNTTK